MYLGKRDFVDHITHVDPIDGVILIDPEYLRDRKVFANVLAAFRYGREDLDVLGLTFRKDLFLVQEQVSLHSIYMYKYIYFHISIDRFGLYAKAHNTNVSNPHN